MSSPETPFTPDFIKKTREKRGSTPEQRRLISDSGAIELQTLFEERPESRETILEMFEIAVRVNEGREGVIFMIDTRDLSDEQRGKLEDLGIDCSDAHAVKLLKTSRPGAIREEFDIHLRAHNTLGAGSKEGEEIYAGVPKPVLVGDIELPKSVRDQMNAYRSIDDGEESEVMMMEYIHGTDVWTLLLQEAYKRIYPHIELDDVKKFPISELEAVVFPHVDIREPGGKGGNEGERNHERIKLETENFEKLMNWLRGKDFVLHESIVKQIEGGTDKLNSDGIVHRDLHQRNVMIEGEANALAKSDEVPRAVIIDFGLSVTTDNFEGDDVYTLGEYKLQRDGTLAKQLKRFTKSRFDEQMELVERGVQDLLSEARRVGDHMKDRDVILDRLQKLLRTEEGTEKCFGWLFQLCQNERDLPKFIHLTLELLESGDISPEVLKDRISQKTDESTGKGKSKRYSMLIPNRNKLLLFNNRFVSKLAESKTE
jgi:tRNA A-37 threonylcarbamoyl transferase component Bud32